MRYRGVTRRALGLAVVIAALAGGSARAANQPGLSADASACSPPSYTFTQPYLSLGDLNWYTLAPGQDADSFTGAGWDLRGGARLVATTLADGKTGTVLDLPAGARATSPPMCVNSDYLSARMTVRDLAGPPSVRMFVAYAGTHSWRPSPSGVVLAGSAWTVSAPMNLHSGDLLGWQNAQYTFIGGSRGTDAQLYGFYIDPRSMH
jgi:hypothetical protein